MRTPGNYCTSKMSPVPLPPGWRAVFYNKKSQEAWAWHAPALMPVTRYFVENGDDMHEDEAIETTWELGVFEASDSSITPASLHEAPWLEFVLALQPGPSLGEAMRTLGYVDIRTDEGDPDHLEHAHWPTKEKP